MVDEKVINRNIFYIEKGHNEINRSWNSKDS